MELIEGMPKMTPERYFSGERILYGLIPGVRLLDYLSLKRDSPEYFKKAEEEKNLLEAEYQEIIEENRQFDLERFADARGGDGADEGYGSIEESYDDGSEENNDSYDDGSEDESSDDNYRDSFLRNLESILNGISGGGASRVDESYVNSESDNSGGDGSINYDAIYDAIVARERERGNSGEEVIDYGPLYDAVEASLERSIAREEEAEARKKGESKGGPIKIQKRISDVYGGLAQEFEKLSGDDGKSRKERVEEIKRRRRMTGLDDVDFLRYAKKGEFVPQGDGKDYQRFVENVKNPKIEAAVKKYEEIMGDKKFDFNELRDLEEKLILDYVNGELFESYKRRGSGDFHPKINSSDFKGKSKRGLYPRLVELVAERIDLREVEKAKEKVLDPLFEKYDEIKSKYVYEESGFFNLMGRIERRFADNDLLDEVEKQVVGDYLANNNEFSLNLDINDLVNDERGAYLALVDHIRQEKGEKSTRKMDQDLSERLAQGYRQFVFKEFRNSPPIVDRNDFWSYGFYNYLTALRDSAHVYDSNGKLTQDGREVAKDLEKRILEMNMHVIQDENPDLDFVELENKTYGDDYYHAFLTELTSASGIEKAVEFDQALYDDLRNARPDLNLPEYSLRSEFILDNARFPIPEDTRSEEAKNNETVRDNTRRPYLNKKYWEVRLGFDSLKSVGADGDGRAFLFLDDWEDSNLPNGIESYVLPRFELQEIQQFIRDGKLTADDITDLYSKPINLEE